MHYLPSTQSMKLGNTTWKILSILTKNIMVRIYLDISLHQIFTWSCPIYTYYIPYFAHYQQHLLKPNVVFQSWRSSKTTDDPPWDRHDYQAWLSYQLKGTPPKISLSTRLSRYLQKYDPVGKHCYIDVIWYMSLELLKALKQKSLPNGKSEWFFILKIKSNWVYDPL